MEYIRHQNTSADRVDRIHRELDKDEQAILISPLDSSILSGNNIGSFVFGTLWTSLSLMFFVFFIIGKDDTPLMATIMICAFVLIGLLVVTSPFWASRKAANTIVAFTTKRVIVDSIKKCTSVPLKQLERISYVEYPGKAGHIKLGSEAFAGLFTLQSVDSNPDLVLASLPDVKSIERILRRYCCKNTGETGPVTPVSWSTDALDRDTKTMIESALEQGESLIWAGKPVRSSIWLLTMIPALAIVGLFSFFGIIMFKDFVKHDVFANFFYLIVAGEILIFVIIFYAFYKKSQRGKSCCYIATNKRAAIFQRLMFDKFEAVNFLPSRLDILRKTKRANGSGNLVFYQKIVQNKNEESRTDKGFLNAPDVDLAEQAINNLIAANQRTEG